MNDDDEIESLPRLDGGKAVLAAILAGATGRTTGGMASADSRIANVGMSAIDLPIDADGTTQTFVYLRRRFLPDPSQFETLRLHATADGERLDQVAAKELSDPLSFWKLCDANRVMSPLSWRPEPGTRLRVPLPPGVAVPRRT